MTQFNRYKPNPDPKVLKAMQGFEADSKIPVGEFMDLYAKFNQAVREVGAGNGVLVIDLAALIPQDKNICMTWCTSTPGGRSWPPNLSARACWGRCQGAGTGEELIPNP